MRISKSKLGMFEGCPFHYKLRYVDYWKPAITPVQLVEGIEKHEIFERVVNKARLSGGNVGAEVEKAVKEEAKYEKYRVDLDNFTRFQRRIKKLPIYQEIMLEDSELNLVGIIDRVDLDSEGLWIIDYKTGVEAKDLDKYRFELALYAYLFEKNHNQRVAGWGIFFSSEGHLVKEARIQGAITAAIKKVAETRKQIRACEESKQWNKVRGKQCEWCEAFQNAACEGNKKVDPVQKLADEALNDLKVR